MSTTEDRLPLNPKAVIQPFEPDGLENYLLRYEATGAALIRTLLLTVVAGSAVLVGIRVPTQLTVMGTVESACEPSPALASRGALGGIDLTSAPPGGDVGRITAVAPVIIRIEFPRGQQAGVAESTNIAIAARIPAQLAHEIQPSVLATVRSMSPAIPAPIASGRATVLEPLQPRDGGGGSTARSRVGLRGGSQPAATLCLDLGQEVKVTFHTGSRTLASLLGAGAAGRRYAADRSSDATISAGWGTVTFSRIPRVRQQDASDCGAACLGSIARHLGGRVSVARIRQLAGTDRQGTSMSGLIRAAEAIGLLARGVRAPIEALASIPLPAIAHLEEDAGTTHFVVLYAVTSRMVQVMDPAHGRIHQIPLAEFAQRWSGVLLLVGRASGRLPHKSEGTTALHRLWRLACPHRSALIAATSGAAVYTILGLATAIFVQMLVDVVLPGGSVQLLSLLGLLMAAIVALQVIIRAQRDLLTLRTGQKLDGALIRGYYEHLLRLPQPFFDTMRVGEVVSRLTDAVKIRRLLNETSLELLVNALVIGTSLPLMFLYSWPIGLLVAASIPLHSGIYLIVNRANGRDQRRTMEAAAELESHLVESVSAMSTLRSLGLEPMASAGAERRLVQLMKPVYSVGRNAIWSGAASEGTYRLATVALLWVGAILVLRQELTPGQLMSLYALNGHLSAPILGLIGANRQVQDALVAVDRLFDVLDLEQEVEQAALVSRAGRTDGLRLEDVVFRFGSGPPLFNGLSLSIDGGARTAIVGASGSGKSTLAGLMQRQHRPESGRCCLGAVDLRHIPRAHLVRAIAIVAQEPVLFTGTLLENLVGWDSNPDGNRLHELLEALALDEMIRGLPAGLATPVGERGLTLSGGQRQRVAIVRAVYRRPRILILDEATSALDPAAETRVQSLLESLQAGGTTIITITHRLAMAEKADRVLVLDRGRLAEAGNHDELLREAGLYHRIWNSQLPIVSAPQAPFPGSRPRPGVPLPPPTRQA